MIFESIEQIKERIEKPLNEDMLKRAKIIREKLELHVAGIGIDKYLDKIQGVENEKAITLRRALAKVITKPETHKIISVINKIFSARGGGRFYDVGGEDKENKFKEILSNVRKGNSIHTFMRKEWKDLINLDPTGIILIEHDKEKKVEITYKSTQSILDIDYNSPTKINYIIFQPETIDKGRLYRVIDDKYDYTILRTSSNRFEIVPELTFPNPWGFVPACFISERQDKQSLAFISHIDECLISADDMLLDYTLYKIYKTKIGIPLHWQYSRQCTTCKGAGEVLTNDEYHVCPNCEGIGADNSNRDIAEIIILPIPENGDVPIVPPSGYVAPDLASWERYELTLDREAKQMYASVWGENVTIEGDRRNITASELTVRESSKEDKLNEISDNEENVEKFIVDTIGFFYFGVGYKGSIINNGRTFDIKGPDELLKLYNESIAAGVPSLELTEILSDYYHTAYKRNPKKLNESLIRLSTKPFFHYSPDYILKLGVNKVDYLKNVYYDEFMFWYEQNKEPFGVTTYEAVTKELETWIQEKLNTNIQEKKEEDETRFKQISSERVLRT